MSRWVPVFASMTAAIGSIAAALIAGRFAIRTRDAHLQSERVLELEKRLASSKADVYQPMVELMRAIFDSSKTKQTINQQRMVETLSKFGAWLQIYGSDEAVREFHKWMQAAYHDAPAEVMLRLYAQFVLAIRRDLGDPRTEVSIGDLLGIRISDFYETMAPLTQDEGEAFAEVGWSPPWEERGGL